MSFSFGLGFGARGSFRVCLFFAPAARPSGSSVKFQVRLFGLEAGGMVELAIRLL